MDEPKLLMDRVIYINGVRMGAFKFYVVVVGALAALVFKESDVFSGADIPKRILLSIGLVSFVVLVLGLGMFVFDIWALARLRATTEHLNVIAGSKYTSSSRVLDSRFRFQEDFWLVFPMIFLNAVVLFLSAFLLLEFFGLTGVYLGVALFFLLLIGQVLAHQILPNRFAREMGPWPDSVQEHRFTDKDEK